MNKKDFIVILIALLLLLPFFLSTTVFNTYIDFNVKHGMITSFIKFAVLASFGEMLALRVKENKYWKPGFGLLPKFIIWGIIGLTIKFALIIFATGVPIFVEYMGINNTASILAGSLSLKKIIIAFSISAAMNIIYAPIMMTMHKITDTHIGLHKGNVYSLFRPIQIARILKEMDWHIMWGFVLKKTIPIFWIPAHTITFLLPPDYQVLFAAALSIMLGLILSSATLISEK